MKRTRILYITIPAIIVLGLLCSLIIPALISSIIQTTVVATLQHDYGLKKCAYVRADFGILNLLSGKVDKIYIECSKGDFQGIKAKSLVITLKDIELDVNSIVFDRKAKIKSVGGANAKLVFGEDEINECIAEKCPELHGWKIKLKSNEMVATADIELIGDLRVAFKPKLKGDHLILNPIDARFARFDDLGLKDAKNWVSEVPISIPVCNLPFGMKVSKVLILDDQLSITAEN